MLPLIGITTDLCDEQYRCATAYASAVVRAGGVPIIVPHVVEHLDRYLALCDGFILTGGDDPRTEEFGFPTHPQARPINARRQAFETALLRRITDQPALGICLGMQMMALTSGGRLDQYLPETLPTHADHWDRRLHPIDGALGRGEVSSHHRQAVADPGSLEICAAASDGVIEALRDPQRRFYLGVQWHPERTGPGPLGDGLFAMLVRACDASSR